MQMHSYACTPIYARTRYPCMRMHACCELRWNARVNKEHARVQYVPRAANIFYHRVGARYGNLTNLYLLNVEGRAINYRTANCVFQMTYIWQLLRLKKTRSISKAITFINYRITQNYCNIYSVKRSSR